MYLAVLLLSPLMIALAFLAKKFSPLARQIKRRWLELTYVGVTLIMFFSHLIITSVMGEAWRNMLTDLCPNSSLFLAIALLLNKKQLIKAVTPWVLVGSLVTFLAEIDNWDLHFGDKREGILNAISFIRHLSMFVISIIILFTYGKYAKKDFLGMLTYLALFSLWVIVFAGVPYWVTNDPKWGVLSTGLLDPSVHGYHLPPDNIHHLQANISGYSIMEEIGLPMWLTRLLFYIVAITVAFLFAFLSRFANKYWEAVKPVVKTVIEPQQNH